MIDVCTAFGFDILAICVIRVDDKFAVGQQVAGVAAYERSAAYSAVGDMHRDIDIRRCAVVGNRACERCSDCDVAASIGVTYVARIPTYVESLLRHINEDVEVLSALALVGRLVFVVRYIVGIQRIVLGVCIVDIELDACAVAFSTFRLELVVHRVHAVDAGIHFAVGVGESVTFGVSAVVFVLACVDGPAFRPPRLREHKLCADIIRRGIAVIACVVDGAVSVCIHACVVFVRADRHIVVRKVAVCERNLRYADLDGHFKRVHNLELLVRFLVPYMDGHLSFEGCGETCNVACGGSVFVGDVVFADVAVCKREAHRVGQFVCADVCEVVVVDVLLGHTGRLVVDDVDISAVAVSAADKSVGDCGILARVRIQIFEVGVVEHEFRVHNRAVKHRDGYVDALFCEHISLFVRESEVRIGLLLELDVILDCDVGLVDLIVVGDIRKDVAAVCFLDANERSRHIRRIALSVLDEFVNVGPVEVCVEHIAAHRGDAHLVGKIGSVFVDERIHNNRAILVVGHEHDASVDDIHFDFACFDIYVLAAVVLVRHRNFELLAEVGSDVVVERLIVEVVFDRN